MDDLWNFLLTPLIVRSVHGAIHLYLYQLTIIADRILKLEPNLYSNKSIIVNSDPKFTENADKVT
jgi:hypothetical protein